MVGIRCFDFLIFTNSHVVFHIFIFFVILINRNKFLFFPLKTWHWLSLALKNPNSSPRYIMLTVFFLIIIQSTFSYFSLYLKVSTAKFLLLSHGKPILASGPLHLIPILDCCPSDLCVLIIQITGQIPNLQKRFSASSKVETPLPLPSSFSFFFFF